ncbi:MAG: protein-(glutamine-N5) methyltransferase, release factor-specific, partial [Bacteroidota bacterium]|nr:protein-(glutamine-N5) methyltransferase, release factor-specific [Bacteroidota bacterium]MDX5431130.1 protein-(glutamine-N5) methyltransferase, release factor-specific [Bacteroidota bacterium]MDX5469877.1 protein-(glutamine-N5) methyltransferase, release factor-specific [Bacteroidota bacterium]
TARMNALRIFGEDEVVPFEKGDILEDSWWNAQPQFDCIVSNPPYIREQEKQAMEAHVLEHEPHEALFVPDTDPFLFYRPIAEQAKNHLSPGGLLFFEINAQLGQEMLQMLNALGYSCELRNDMQGKDRMIKAWQN